MVVNEEGKLLGLPINLVATAIYSEWGYKSDYIVGNVLVAYKERIK